MMNIKSFAKSDFTKSAMSAPSVFTALRRDATFIWNGVIVVVFVSFAGLAVASALLDLMSIR